MLWSPPSAVEVRYTASRKSPTTSGFSVFSSPLLQSTVAPVASEQTIVSGAFCDAATTTPCIPVASAGMPTVLESLVTMNSELEVIVWPPGAVTVVAGPVQITGMRRAAPPPGAIPTWPLAAPPPAARMSAASPSRPSRPPVCASPTKRTRVELLFIPTTRERAMAEMSAKRADEMVTSISVNPDASGARFIGRCPLASRRTSSARGRRPGRRGPTLGA